MGTSDIHLMLNIFLAIMCILLTTVVIFLVAKLYKIKEKDLMTEMTDSFTGIGNLAYFEYHFDNTISEFSRCLYHIAYIIVDINYLQAYHGTTTFNDVVKYTAEVLTDASKSNEVAARITENGFVFAFQSMDKEDAKSRLESILEKLNEYIDTDIEHRKPIFHAALYNLNTFDRNSELVLFNLRRNCAKIIGTMEQLVCCGEKDMNKAVEEKELLESFERGFINHEFKLYLQFVVDNKTNDIVSAEALSRWDNPEKGLLTPGSYIETMETSGLISMLDFYMFELVCERLDKWKNTQFSNISLSCNFTRITLSEENFLEKIKVIYSKYSFDKSKLIIEITEDAVERNMKNALSNVTACKEMGFKIALDDLGSGHTSLINLCDYPIDIVKIDRSILLETDKERGKALFGGIVALAQSLGLKVVCEGVEKVEHNEFVSKSECDYIQGWYYSRVFPVEESEDFARYYQKEKI